MGGKKRLSDRLIWISGIATLLLAAPAFSAEPQSASVADLAQRQLLIPFIWPDVAFVSIVSAVPLALLLTAGQRRRIYPLVSCGLGLAILLSLYVLLQTSLSAEPGKFPYGIGIRSAITLTSIAAAAGLAFLLNPILRYFTTSGNIWDRMTVSRVVCGCLILWLAPMMHIQSRLQYDTRRLIELVEQSRLGEAYALASRVLLLDRAAQTPTGPVTMLMTELERDIQHIESQLQQEPSRQGTSNRQIALQRSRDFAILGRTTEAISMLQPLLVPPIEATPFTAEACTLLGTIYETRQEWTESRHWYAQAQSLWKSLDMSAEREAGQVRATKGTAFCSRKLGLVKDAETAWLKVLELSPGADSHFLLAQFFEDTQQTERALLHAEKAMYLAPERYRKDGNRMIDRMQTLHFGCLNVYYQRLR